MERARADLAIGIEVDGLVAYGLLLKADAALREAEAAMKRVVLVATNIGIGPDDNWDTLIAALEKHLTISPTDAAYVAQSEALNLWRDRYGKERQRVTTAKAERDTAIGLLTAILSESRSGTYCPLCGCENSDGAPHHKGCPIGRAEAAMGLVPNHT
jgi:hypothetical protein